jgi:hypothetical protein
LQAGEKRAPIANNPINMKAVFRITTFSQSPADKTIQPPGFERKTKYSLFGQDRHPYAGKGPFTHHSLTFITCQCTGNVIVNVLP